MIFFIIYYKSLTIQISLQDRKYKLEVIGNNILLDPCEFCNIILLLEFPKSRHIRHKALRDIPCAIHEGTNEFTAKLGYFLTTSWKVTDPVTPWHATAWVCNDI